MSFFTTGNKYEKQERLVSSRKDAAIRVVNKVFDRSRAVKDAVRPDICCHSVPAFSSDRTDVGANVAVLEATPCARDQ